MEQGSQMGLEGKELYEFVIEQQKIEQEKEKADREDAAEQRKLNLQLKLEKMRQDHELELEKIRQEYSRLPANSTNITAELPTLPIFQDDHDNIDSYLERFERFATLHKWNRSDWAMVLSSLLTGNSLDVYARLPDEEATDYDKIKIALQKRYNLTEEGFRLKFRKSTPKEDENPAQFITRIGKYLDKWTDLGGATDCKMLKTLLIKEQFLNMCNKHLAIYLKEKPFVNMQEMCDRAERYLEAHKQKLANDNEQKSRGN